MKNYKNLSKNNNGYTLVEMIIVIAIVAVLSSMALVSITLINSAKAKEASVTFDSEIATLITKSKNTVCLYDADNDDVAEEQPAYQHCLWVYRGDNSTYYVKQGYYDTVNKKYIFDDTDSTNEGKGKSLSHYVTIQRVNGATTETVDETGMYIRYSKDGTCVEGTGDYQFFKRNGNIVSHVVLRKNGSHELR